MPLYEYVCKGCGVRFEKLRSMKDADAPIPCPECQCPETSRAISLFCAVSSDRGVVAGSSASCDSCASNSCSTCASRR